MLQVLYTTKKGYDGVYIILNEKYDSYLASAGHSFQIPLLLMATGSSRLKLKSIQKKSQEQKHITKNIQKKTRLDSSS